MKFLATSLLLLLQGLPPLIGPLIPDTGGRIVGIVRRSDTGQPIPGAQVGVALAGAPAESAMTRAVTADMNGRFTIASVQSGRYTIIAQADGYFSFLNDPALAGRAKKDVTVIEGQQIEVGTIELLPAAAISGRISAPDGHAVIGASVQAWRASYDRGRLTFNLIKTATTDDLGEYRLFWLLPGEYYVSAQYRVAGPERYSRVFFPGAVDEDGAPPIIAGGGRELSGIDLQIPIAPLHGVTVTGRVTIEGNTAQQLRVPSVAVIPKERRISFVGDPASLYANQGAGSPGRFEIHNVPPGEYDFFPALGNADSPVYPVQIAVSVADRDVENVDLPLDPQIEISGRLTLDGAGPGERLKDSIALVRLDGLPGKTTATVISPKPETGDFEIKDFSVGRYAIRLDPDVRSAGIYVSDMTYGGASVPDSELIVKEPASALKIELKSDGGTVAGTVLDVTRLRPYPYATVALLPESGRRRDYTLYRDATAEPDGRFSFTGVPPGNYVLFAWQTVTRGAWQNPIFLGRYENRGTPVVVEAAVTRTLQIVAIP